MEELGYTAEAARDKNRDEYNQTADKYDAWCKSNLIM